MAPDQSLVVVGASVAGVRVVRSARERGWNGSITLLEASDEWPHDKPSLSKSFLLGKDTDENVALETPSALQELDVTFRPRSRAKSLDLAAKTVNTESETYSFDQLVLTNGCNVRKLDCLRGMQGVHYLRTRKDSVDLRADLLGSQRLVIVGGGFIGAEVAASARSLGLEVTILESSAQLLHRALPAVAADAIAAIHEGHGVSITYNARVVGANATGGRVTELVLSDGRKVAADIVAVGIGTTPNTKWLEGSGLALADGVICDDQLRTSAVDVWAAGDIASWFNRRYSRHMRMQHWTSAREQASIVAHNVSALTSTYRHYSAVPYIWSDQHEARIQHVGFAGDDVVRLDSDAGGQIFLYSTGDQIMGATTINAQREMLKLRRLLVEPRHISEYLTA